MLGGVPVVSREKKNYFSGELKWTPFLSRQLELLCDVSVLQNSRVNLLY